jgi:glycosyltransferase involved in cell wall biosynthesis
MNSSLIITTYNWPEALSLVLSSLNEQTVLPDEVIIADDGSEDSTKIVIDNFKNSSSIPIIHSWQKDKGFRLSKSRNKAIAKAKSEYIIMIDGDMVMHKDFIKDHKRFAKKNTYLQGGRVLLQKDFSLKLLNKKQFNKPRLFSSDFKNKINSLRLPFLSFIISLRSSVSLNRVRGCNFSIHREDIIRVNGFNEDFVSWGKEDSEFVSRLFHHGILRKDMKFSGLQYHLFHKEGFAQNNNLELLDITISKKLDWCLKGIDQYL